MALATLRKIVPQRSGADYPYAEKRGDQCVLGVRRLPQEGSGPPWDEVLGFGQSWQDAVAMLEATP
jgi:hypothetical protein